MNYLKDKDFRQMLLLFVAGILIINLATILVVDSSQARSYTYVAITLGSLLLSLIAILVSIWQYGSQRSSEGVLSSQLRELSDTGNRLNEAAKKVELLPDHLSAFGIRLEKTATQEDLERFTKEMNRVVHAPSSEAVQNQLISPQGIFAKISPLMLTGLLILQKGIKSGKEVAFIRAILDESGKEAQGGGIAGLITGSLVATAEILRNVGLSTFSEDGMYILSDDLRAFIEMQRTLITTMNAPYQEIANAIQRVNFSTINLA